MGCIQYKRHHDDVYEPEFNFVRPRTTNYHKKREQEEDLPMIIIMEVDGPTQWDPTPLYHLKLDDDDDDDYIEFPQSSRKSDPGIDPDYDPISDMIGITSLDVVNPRSHKTVGTVVLDNVVDYTIEVDDDSKSDFEFTSAVPPDETFVDCTNAAVETGLELGDDFQGGSVEVGAKENDHVTEIELVTETQVIIKNSASPGLDQSEQRDAFQPILQHTLSEAGDAGSVVTMTTQDEPKDAEFVSLLRDMMEKVVAMTITATEDDGVVDFLEVILKAVEVAADAGRGGDAVRSPN